MPKHPTRRMAARPQYEAQTNNKKQTKRSRRTPEHRVRRSKRLERMSNAPHGQKVLTAAREFFDIPEMLDRLAKTLEWSDLNNLANTSFYANCIVARIIRERIRSRSSPFLSKPEDMEQLFEVLRRAYACVTGSLGWSVMTGEDTQYEHLGLNDLNITTPRGIHNVLPCINFFREIGYDFMVCKKAKTPYKDVASRIITLQRGGYTVTITESSTDSILPVVVSSPLTSMMNIITAHRIYCMYPSLLKRRVSVKGVHSIPASTVLLLKHRGIRIEWSTSCQDACGEICPAHWRRTKNLTGVESTVWNPFANTKFTSNIPSWEGELGCANFKWRLGLVCRNRRCPNFSPSITASSISHERLR